MANLNRVPKIATTTTPKMSRFKMGVQSKYRETKRLSAKQHQSFFHKGKEYHLEVDTIYSHNDGTYTGIITFYGKRVHVVSRSGAVWLAAE